MLELNATPSIEAKSSTTFEYFKDQKLFLLFPLILLLALPFIPVNTLKASSRTEQILILWFVNVGMLNIFHQAIALKILHYRWGGDFALDSSAKLKVILYHIFFFCLGYLSFTSLQSFIFVILLLNIRGLDHMIKQSYGLNAVVNKNLKVTMNRSENEARSFFFHDKLLYWSTSALAAINLTAFTYFRSYIAYTLIATAFGFLALYAYYLKFLSKSIGKPELMVKGIYSARLFIIFIASTNVFYSLLARTLHSIEYLWTYLRLRKTTKNFGAEGRSALYDFAFLAFLITLFHVLFFWHPQFGLYKLISDISSPVGWTLTHKIIASVYLSLSHAHTDVDRAIFSMKSKTNQDFIREKLINSA